MNNNMMENMIEKDIIYNEDCLSGLKKLPDNCIDCCVTSPPYFQLREYDTARWEGGDAECKHVKSLQLKRNNSGGLSNKPKGRGETDYSESSKILYKDVCEKCGAKRIDQQIGLEETPEAYIQMLVDVFREVRRVLKPEGTTWINIGDSYASSGDDSGLKPKDLIGVPWMLAFALRTDGWWLRQELIWSKPNCLPESVTDRCTKSHEHIFLLSKSQKYHFDYKAIQELAAYDGRKDTVMKGSEKYKASCVPGQAEHTMASGGHERWNKNEAGEYIRNKRSVWTVSPKPLREAHYAAYPQELIVDCIKAGCPGGGGSSRSIYGKWNHGDCSEETGVSLHRLRTGQGVHKNCGEQNFQRNWTF